MSNSAEEIENQSKTVKFGCNAISDMGFRIWDMNGNPPGHAHFRNPKSRFEAVVTTDVEIAVDPHSRCVCAKRLDTPYFRNRNAGRAVGCVEPLLGDDAPAFDVVVPMDVELVVDPHTRCVCAKRLDTPYL